MEAFRALEQGGNQSDDAEIHLVAQEIEEEILDAYVLNHMPVLRSFILEAEAVGKADVLELTTILNDLDAINLREAVLARFNKKQIKLNKDEQIDDGHLKPTEGPLDTDALQAYLRDIGKIPILNAAREVELAKKMEQGRYAEELLLVHELINNLENHELKKIADELIELNIPIEELEAILASGVEAKKIMISSNLKLVVSIVKKYRGNGLSFVDLISEGNAGVIRAVEKFEWRKGFKFSTYATWWIRQAAQRAVANQSRTIRLPVHVHEQCIKLNRAERELKQRLQRDPTIEELAEAVRLSVDKVEELKEAPKSMVSLQQPVGENGESEFGDFLEDRSIPSQEEIQEDTYIVQMVSKYLESLTERERMIIQMRYGFIGDEIHSLEVIGRKLEITKERVRQIERHAKDKIMSLMKKDGLNEHNS